MNDQTPYRYRHTSATIGNMEVAKTVADALIPTSGLGGIGSAYFSSPTLAMLFGGLLVLFGAFRLGLAAVIVRSKAKDPID